MSELEYPAELRYTPEHEWVAATGEGTFRVGITAFAQDALGDAVYVSMPEVGDSVTEGAACGEVESTKSVSDLYAPITGEVTAVNQELESTPELLNSDPYGQGWIYECRTDDKNAFDRLMDSESYTAQLD